MYKPKIMNSKNVLGARLCAERPVGSLGSISGREGEKFKDLRPGQILSVRKACDKFLESRGLKQIPFGTFVLRKTENKGQSDRKTEKIAPDK
jgi:hypothetical protein